MAANGTITSDLAPSGASTSSTYNAGAQLCNVAATVVACGATPTAGTNYQYTLNGQRSVATTYAGGVATATTNYAWNAYGQLCNVATTATACGSTPSLGTSYQYNGSGLRMSATTATSTSTSTTASTWDNVSGGSIPLNINDATTSSSSPGTTTNTSYIYGNLLFGGTAPVEQITGSTATFLVANQTGVQGVFSSSGAPLEMAIYSTYGTQSITSGANVSPFGFQGSYTDSTGLIYLINRYYDPTNDQFLSVDPMVEQTNQPYAFVNDNPLNSTDPLGLCNRTPRGRCHKAPAPKPAPKPTSPSRPAGGIVNTVNDAVSAVPGLPRVLSDTSGFFSGASYIIQNAGNPPAEIT